MSEQAQKRSTGDSPASKSERRLAAKLAAQKAAEARRRRRQALVAALAGLAVVGVTATAFLVLGGEDEPTEGTAATGSAAATPSAGTPGAVRLPEGADPALGTKPTVTAGDGELTKLTVTPLITGKGPATTSGQQITVNYVGVFYGTGEEFDASWNRDQPFSFQLGAGRVIPGWDQGLVGVTVGSRVQVDIPAELAYGDGAGGRPAGPLRFVVDVLAAE